MYPAYSTGPLLGRTIRPANSGAKRVKINTRQQAAASPGAACLTRTADRGRHFIALRTLVPAAFASTAKTEERIIKYLEY